MKMLKTVLLMLAACILLLSPVIALAQDPDTSETTETESTEMETAEASESGMICETDYVVQVNDWLSKIAEKTYNNVLAYPAIAAATNTQSATDDTYASIDDPDIIEPGWVLCLPSADDASAILASGDAAQYISKMAPSRSGTVLLPDLSGTALLPDLSTTETETDTSANSATEADAAETSESMEAATEESTDESSEGESMEADTEESADESSESESMEADTPPGLPLDGQVWQLASYGDVDDQQAVLAAVQVTAGFFPEGNESAGRLSGSTGCNAFFTTYAADGETLTVAATAATRIACAVPEGVMEQEQAFLTALVSADKYRTQGEQLEVFYNGGDSVLTFVAQ